MNRDRIAKIWLSAVAVFGAVAAVLVVRGEILAPSFADEAAVEDRAVEDAAVVPGAAASRIAAGGTRTAGVAAGVIRGRVHDAAGAGIAGALLRLVPKHGFFAVSDEEASALSDESGAFEVVAAGGTCFSLVAEAAGFAPEAEDRVRAGDAVDFELAPAAALDGLVVDEEGTPVPGAAITFFCMVGAHEIERTATSDAQGKWLLEGLPMAPAGSAWLTAKARGFAACVTDKLWGALRAGVVRYTVVLRRGSAVAGAIVDASTGAPIAGARVEIAKMPFGFADRTLSKRFRRLLEAVAGADGAFRINGVPAADAGDPLVWVASAPGYARAVEELPAAADGAETPLRIKLWLSGVVEGRVVDRLGRPVAGAEVQVQTWYGSRRLLLGDEREGSATDPAGRFRLEGVAASPEGVSLTAIRESGQRGWGGASVVAAAGTTTTVPDLVMTLAPAAVVRVRDPDGAAVAGAAVEVEASWPDLRLWITGADGRVLVSFERALEQVQSKLPAYVRVSGRGFVDLVPPPFIPDVDAPPEVEVTLARAWELRCRVTWADGSDAAGIPVAVASGAWPAAAIWPRRGEPPASAPADAYLAMGETDARGRCRFEKLPPAPWHVAAWLEPQDDEPAARIESVADASREIAIVLAEPRPESRPDAETGRPVLDAAVFVENRAGLPAGPGVFRCTVPRSIVRVHVWCDGYARGWDRRIDLSVPGNERVEVKLEPGVVVKGRARLPEGTPITGAEISCQWSDRDRRAVPLLPTGDFEIRGVPVGVAVDFLIQIPSLQTAWNFVPMPFEAMVVPAGRPEVTVDLTFIPATQVVLTLQDQRGKGGIDPWELNLTGTSPAWSRQWRVSGPVFRGTVPIGPATGSCEIPGSAPQPVSFDFKEAATYRGIVFAK
jgi:Carboxypeptidase regulatory-like domain